MGCIAKASAVVLEKGLLVVDTLIEFMLFVGHAAILNATMNETLEHGYTTIYESARFVYELTYELGSDIHAVSCV